MLQHNTVRDRVRDASVFWLFAVAGAELLSLMSGKRRDLGGVGGYLRLSYHVTILSKSLFFPSTSRTATTETYNALKLPQRL